MAGGVPPFDAFFEECSAGRQPYQYQCDVANQLFAGQHVEVWAPTGAGKTLAVLAPFLWQFRRGDKPRWDRLIYVLPLRSLVESIAAEAQKIVDGLGLPSDFEVRVQTGENPSDAFFSEGRIILTTYDQLLSGALEGPYGLPNKLHNINASAVAGALVVFDEYHLMGPASAFLTAVAHIQLYKPLCQSVWMTATATSELQKVLADALQAKSVRVAPEELAKMPAVAEVTRRVTLKDAQITVAGVLERHRSRSIVLVNRVARADALYDELKALAPDEHIELLHARFFPKDRKDIEERVRELFMQGSTARCILVCTQVIEAGMNISAEVLHTEAAPMSALVQRAGRCARFPGESGDVLVYPLPEPEGRGQPWLPYTQEEITHSRSALAGLSEVSLGPAKMRELVNAAHAENDARQLRSGWQHRRADIEQRTLTTVTLRQMSTISDLIRPTEGPTIRVVIAWNPVTTQLNPYQVEGFGLRKWPLLQLFEIPQRPIGWRWVPTEDQEWVPLEGPGDLDKAFVVCLSPAVAAYTKTRGLRLGEAGRVESPLRPPKAKKGTGPLHRETWERHAREVGEEAAKRVEAAGVILIEGFAAWPWEIPAAQLVQAARTVGLLHDVGKLQTTWQAWAERAQRSIDAAYEHTRPLAHTDFDPQRPEDRERERLVNEQGKRPPHAAQSAWYSVRAAGALLHAGGHAVKAELRAASLAALIGHHGGWLGKAEESDLPVLPLVAAADTALQEASRLDNLPALAAPKLKGAQPRYAALSQVLALVVGGDAWRRWWPLIAYLTRTLRLADQRATSMYQGEDS